MLSNQNELDLKAENERLKSEVERQRKEINDACASLTLVSRCATNGRNLITLVEAAINTAGNLHKDYVDLKAEIRKAVADYMYSEGCSCCCDIDAHADHKKKLAQLLEVPQYSDGSGYDFYQFRSPNIEEGE